MMFMTRRAMVARTIATIAIGAALTGTGVISTMAQEVDGTSLVDAQAGSLSLQTYMTIADVRRVEFDVSDSEHKSAGDGFSNAGLEFVLSGPNDETTVATPQDSGHYVFDLPAGDYRLTASVTGDWVEFTVDAGSTVFVSAALFADATDTGGDGEAEAGEMVSELPNTGIGARTTTPSDNNLTLMGLFGLAGFGMVAARRKRCL